MFDLHQAVAEWRRQMLADGIRRPMPLEELEIHLRDEIEQQMKSGLTPQHAFEIASKKIGQAPELKREFKKVGTPMATQLVKLAGIACFTVAFLFSAWILRFLFHHEIGPTAKLFGLAAIATTVLGWKYGHKLLPVVCRQQVRTAIGLVCCVGGVVWIQLFIINFMPRLMLHPPGMDVPEGRLMVAFLWGWTVMAVFAGTGHGLEKATRRQA